MTGALVLLGGIALAACGDDGAATAPVSTGSTVGPSTSATTTSTTEAVTTTTAFDGVVDELRVEVIERRNHDADVSTQGLELDDGLLFETGGLYGESTVRVVDPETGEVVSSIDLDDELFAEGLTLIDGNLIVLTWREGIALVLDQQSLAERARFTYDGEGWGLCDDGNRLVMSNGSDRLTFRDRTTFAPLSEIAVTLDGAPVSQLNELECVAGAVYANVWQTDTIVRIDPASGAVTARIDASGLLDARDLPRADVLNGIAYDPAADTFLVTGKRWPALFEVRFVPVA